MIIQVGHARNSEYQKNLYIPLKEADCFEDVTWLFPHYGSHIDSRDSLQKIDLFLAEVSTPSLGLGIEMGLVSGYKKPILCISKRGVEISTSLKYVTHDFIEYTTKKDMIHKIRAFLDTISFPKTTGAKNGK